MSIQLAVILLLIAVLLVVLIDVVPIIVRWTKRIKIGRYSSCEVWKDAVSKKGVQWLNRTPKIKVTDNNRLIIIDMMKGNYTKSAIQHWQEAALLLGLGEQIKDQDDLNIQSEVKKFLDKKFNQNGEWINSPDQVDVAILAYAVMKIKNIDIDKYKPALDSVWDLIQQHIGDDGTVAYRLFMKDYRYVDTIGFICPFLITYGITYKKEACIDLAVKQIQEYEKYGMLTEYYIPCHAYQIHTQAPLGLCGWGRGLGWFAIGVIDSWKELPVGHRYKRTLEASVKAFAATAMRFQQPSGNWNWTVTRSECSPDSSATATLAWFLLGASSIEGIADQCKESVEKAIRYLMGVTTRDGEVDFSQGDTKDIGVYSMSFNILPFTQGFCMRISYALKKLF